MAEYIDREALVEHLNVLSYGRFTEMPLYMVVMGTINEIKKFPSADVQPVAHGKWINTMPMVVCNSHYNTRCSVCESIEPYGNYCRNCGARMK